MSLTRGQRVPVSDLGVSDVLHLGLGVRPAGFEIVVAGLEEDETLVDRAFLLSRHQPSSFEGSVRIVTADRPGEAVAIDVALDRVPSSVRTLRIALIGDARLSADDLREAWLWVSAADGHETARWSFTGAELNGERAIIVADLYRRDGWRLVLHGTGYRAGLRAFLERIGGGTRLPGAPEAPPPAPAPAAPPAAPFPPPPGVGAPPPDGPSSPAPGSPRPGGAGAFPPGAGSPVPAAGSHGAGSGSPGGAPGWPSPGAGSPSPPGAGSGWSPSSPGPPRPDLRRAGGRPLRTGLSWRERILSVPVARALVSPLGLGLAAGGAVAGGAGAAAVGVPIVLGAAGVGGAAWLGRAAAAVPGRRGEKIDPFALREPWRHFVRDALGAHDTFTQLVKRTPEGPLRDRLATIAERMEAGVRESWRIASRGETLVEARLAIDDTAARAELAALHDPRATGDPASRARLAEALQSQIDAADRLDRIIDATYDDLRLMDARMDNAVTRALEVSVSATDTTAFGHLGAEVDGLVDDLEALRQGLEEIRGVQPG
ncbi:MAG TPA: TerD family protein [Iamia sp.]|nr:TerD family protein [Iamia sp.]